METNVPMRGFGFPIKSQVTKNGFFPLVLFSIIILRALATIAYMPCAAQLHVTSLTSQKA